MIENHLHIPFEFTTSYCCKDNIALSFDKKLAENVTLRLDHLFGVKISGADNLYFCVQANINLKRSFKIEKSIVKPNELLS
ncbi:hypothetical protein BST86_12885 [Nonlabens agnitus]|uniref:Uncharacterized protein n=1 Tax=Nonlabens agnitus TaxID=870484 RepID=A0A2S9WWV5_9FLAO|nr:hypothetical protein BST86_12885 [Nonlabens agnitus]